MSRYEKMFQRLKENKKGAFIPFVMLFDPNYATCKKIIFELIKAGADALELGIPFSDPVADGPVIQKAGLRALKNNLNLKDAFKLISQIREAYSDIPMGVLTYANIVYKYGPQNFYEQAHQSGLDSVLIADAPLLEVDFFSKIALENKIDPVLIAPLNLPKEKIPLIAKNSKGYVYVVTRSGVTGSSEKLSFNHLELISELKKFNAPPCIFGFGISNKEQAQKALQQGASGVIVGSKIVSIIEDNLEHEDAMLTKLHEFVLEFK